MIDSQNQRWQHCPWKEEMILKGALDIAQGLFWEWWQVWGWSFWPLDLDLQVVMTKQNGSLETGKSPWAPN